MGEVEERISDVFATSGERDYGGSLDFGSKCERINVYSGLSLGFGRVEGING